MKTTPFFNIPYETNFDRKLDKTRAYVSVRYEIKMPVLDVFLRCDKLQNLSFYLYLLLFFFSKNNFYP